MSLTDDDKKWITKAIVIGVGEALDHVVLPKFDSIDKKFDSIGVKIEDLKVELKNDIAKLERKLDQVTGHQAEKLTDHEKRIDRLEDVALS